MGKTGSRIRFVSGCVVAVGVAAGCGVDSETPTTGRVVARHARYLRALDETVQFVTAESSGGASRKYVVRANGELQKASTVLAEELSAHLAKFGALDRDLAARVSEMNATESVRVSISLRSAYTDTHADERSALTTTREQSRRADWSAQVQQATAPVVDELKRIGATNVRGAELVPLIFANTTADQLRVIARMPDVARISETRRGAATEMSPPASPGNSMTVPGIDQDMNPTYTGAGQAIGIVEDATCRLFAEHDAMQGVDLQTQDVGSLPSCQTSVGCSNACGSQNSICDPNTFQCIDAHASRIASTIAQRLGMAGDYGAWEATIYHPSRGDGTAVKCSDEGIANAYDWLDSRSSPAVGITTESFSCETEDGLAQDYYARYHDLTVFRSAGNLGIAESALPGCRPMNSVCVGGMQPKSGGGYEMWPDSNAENPATTNGDREEPDIVALSKEVDVIATVPPVTMVDPLDVSSWAPRNGTSYAAPAMATMAVLMRESCGVTNPRITRAMMMNSAWSINPAGPAYSTPQGGQDFQDGAGSPTARNLLRFCPGNGGDLTTGIGGGTAHKDGGDDAPPWMEERDHSLVATPGLQPLGLDSNGNPFKIEKITEFELRAGDRVRVTFTWDSCPGSTPVGTGPGDLAADMDLFLCDWDSETCLAKSRSFDNNIEGFDVEVPAGTPTATYALHYGWDPDSPFCDNGLEPWGYAFVYGRNTFFD